MPHRSLPFLKIRRPSQPPKRARIEIIPMIDIIFFLLVFFMLSSLAKEHLKTFPIHLPETQAEPSALKAQTSPRPQVTLSIEKEGVLWVDQIQANPQTLKKILETKLPKQGTVLIYADQAAPYQLLLQVLEEARKAGVQTFSFASKPSLSQPLPAGP